VVTQSVAANAEESSSASVELRERAEHLSSTVSAFTTDEASQSRPRLQGKKPGSRSAA
jgi:hypothetical protein